ncbi:MAG TPA: hypothetical protein VF796_04445 [Humisphaera sp.]
MEDVITVRQAYLAMHSFLDELHSVYGFDQLGGLLGSMSLLADGTTADPAMWADWMRAVQRARNAEVDAALRLGPISGQDERGH